MRRTRGSMVWTAAAVSAAAMGTARTTSAMTIAHHVYSRPIPPNGPLRANSPQTTTPTTTVGKASIVLSTVMAARRPQNRVVPTTNPMGIPNRQAIMVETSATRSESSAMPNTSASPLITSSAPRRMPSAKKSTAQNRRAYPTAKISVGCDVHSDSGSASRSRTGGSLGARSGSAKNPPGYLSCQKSSRPSSRSESERVA